LMAQVITFAWDNVHQSPSQSTGNGTVEAWIYLSSAPSYFVALGSGTEYGSTWDDGWLLGRHGGYSDKLVFGIWSGGWNFADSGIAPESLVGGWHHLAGTWGSQGVEIWIDGVLKGQNSFTAGLQNASYATALIGADSWTWCTPGLIDEVRISSVQRDFLPVPEPVISIFLTGLVCLATLPWLRRKTGQ
jgi:hypothetical protein